MACLATFDHLRTVTPHLSEVNDTDPVASLAPFPLWSQRTFRPRPLLAALDHMIGGDACDALEQRLKDFSR